MANMNDVARQAGVSLSTVSHVVNGTRNVEAGTRQRVLDAIKATGYRQDVLARAMRRSRTDSIGLVVSDAGEPAFADMVHGVEHAAVQNGLTLVLANSAEDAAREERAVHTLLDRRVDGLILARSAATAPGLLSTLANSKAPVILLDRIFPELPFDQVGGDNREAMQRLVAHLAAAGHRRFVLVAGDQWVPTLRERREGFDDGVHRAGLDIDQQLVLHGDDESNRIELRSRLNARGFTALLASSTPLAALALAEVQRSDRVIGEDLAFATFDGFNHPDLFQPRITTVRQPAFDMGVSAVRLLVDRLESRDASPRTVRLQQRLELRDSTERIRIGSADLTV
jgi:LacI family transcriptional regulator